MESQENEKYEVLNEKDSQDLKEVSVSLDLELNLPSLTNLTTIWSPLLSGELCCIGLTGFELAVHQQQKHGISFEPQEMYSLMKIWYFFFFDFNFYDCILILIFLNFYF